MSDPDTPKRKRAPSKLTKHDPRRRQLGGRKPGAGRPPKGYSYDPKSIHGLRDAARARAAGAMEDCVELWVRMVRAGLVALRALEANAHLDPTSQAAKEASVTGSLAGKTVTVSRTGGEGSYDETREESAAYAGLDWGDVNRAAENLADRAGLARKTELDLDAGDVVPKLYRLGTYKTKDGERHELPRDTTGDRESD